VSKPDNIIQADGTLSGLNIIDINNDKKFEVLLSSFELSLTNIKGALISGGIDQNVLLFALEDNKYIEDPVTTKEVELSFSLSNGQSGEPVVNLSEIDGDGLEDLILSEDEEQMKIYYGKNNKRMFSKKAVKQDIV